MQEHMVNCKHIHTCGQFYPQRKKLHVTIVDTGNTIVSNVIDFFKSSTMKSSDCIDWAMVSGNTTKTGNISGGLGLGLIFDFINLSKGNMQVISSNGYWELREGKKFMTDLNFSFIGTIVNLEFDLQNPDTFYYFKDEIFEDINIDEIFK